MGRQRRAYREMRPQFREGENSRVSTKWRSLVLDYLAETSNVTEAAKRCGANPSRAYKLRRAVVQSGVEGWPVCKHWRLAENQG